MNQWWDEEAEAEKRYDQLPVEAQDVVMNYALFFALNIENAKVVACASMLPLDYQMRLNLALWDVAADEDGQWINSSTESF